MVRRITWLASLLAPMVLACSSSDDPARDPPIDTEPDLSPMGGDRPVTPYVPDSYRSTIATPLVLLLHGYGAGGMLQEIYLGLRAVAADKGFILISPDGTVDEEGNRFWNATDSCCDFYDTAVDDDAYLMGLIEEAKRRYNIDPKRVYVMGHSNGGYMSYRMACAHADVFAGMASLAGAMYHDASLCNPSEPVSVLQMHGTNDDTVLYEGGDELGGWDAPYPSAEQSVAAWVGLNGCDPAADESLPSLDLVPEHEGSETTVQRWGGCAGDTEVQLWTMHDEPHIPEVGPAFGQAVLAFILAQPKP